MYDELVKRLRDAAKMSEALAVLLPHSEGNVTAKLCNEAADAIEELIEKLNHADDQIVRLVDAAEERRWISVEERLPEKRENVVFRSRGGSVYIGNCVLGTYPPDSEIVAAWFGCGAGMVHDITHWMPLPEPPKEET